MAESLNPFKTFAPYRKHDWHWTDPNDSSVHSDESSTGNMSSLSLKFTKVTIQEPKETKVRFLTVKHTIGKAHCGVKSAEMQALITTSAVHAELKSHYYRLLLRESCG